MTDAPYRDGHTSDDSFDRAEKIAEACRLRRAKVDYATIGRKLGVHKSTVHRWVKAAIAEVPREDAADLLAIEMERLDEMDLAIRAQALKGDLRAIDQALKIHDRRARLMHLDEAYSPDTSAEARGALEDLVAAIRGSVTDDDVDAAKRGAP